MKQRLLLPDFGSGTPCVFTVIPSPVEDVAGLRITVLHENRTLQSFRLATTVTPGGHLQDDSTAPAEMAKFLQAEPTDIAHG